MAKAKSTHKQKVWTKYYKYVFGIIFAGLVISTILLWQIVVMHQDMIDQRGLETFNLQVRAGALENCLRENIKIDDCQFPPTFYDPN